MTDKMTLTFKLDEPIKLGDDTYNELTFERLKARHMAAMDLVKGQTKKSFAMYASMAGVPIQVIEELDADDFNRMHPARAAGVS